MRGKFMDKPLVSIIIVTWNGTKYLRECISSLINQSYKNFEIILVDNASSDDSVELVTNNFPFVKIIQNSVNLGFAKGTNIGIMKAKGDLLGLFNQDAVADKDWLANLVNAIEKSENTAAVAGKVFYYGDMHGKNAIFCTWSKIDPYTGSPSNFSGDEPLGKVDYLTGCAMLVKREAIDEIGLLDTGYFMYFDETDWCARMVRAGYDLIYVPSAVAWHVVSASLGEGKLKLYYMVRSRIRFVLKNFDAMYIPVFLISFIFETIFELVNGIKQKNLQNSKIYFRAIYWNIFNIFNTLKTRKEALSAIKKIRSYNRSLPLRLHKIGLIERYISCITGSK